MTWTRKLVLAGFVALALVLNVLVRRQSPLIGSFCPILTVPQAAQDFEE